MTRPVFSLSQKVFLAFAAILLPILVIFLISFLHSKKELEAVILKDLLVHADDRGNDIIGFVELNKQRAADFASDGFIAGSLTAMQKTGRRDDGRLSAYIRNNKMPLDPKIIRVVLFGNNKIIVSTEPSYLHAAYDGMEMPAKGAAGVSVRVIPSAPSGVPEIAFIAPVRPVNGDASAGALVTFLRLSEFEKLIGNALIPQINEIMPGVTEGFKTLDIYLVDAKGQLLTVAKYMENGVLNRQIKNWLIDACNEKGQRSTSVYKDYRSIEVVGASMCIPLLGWTLLVEVDRDEALKPILDNMRYAIASVVIIVGLLAALYLYFVRAIIDQITGLTNAAKEVAAGNYAIRLPVKSNDEIGVLTRAFDEMTNGLKVRSAALEEFASRLSNAQRIAHFGSLEWKPLTDEMSWSDELYRIFGVHPASFEPSCEGFLGFIHPDSRGVAQAAMDCARTDGKPCAHTCRVIALNGAEKTVRIQCETAFDDAGAVVRVSGIVQDITEQARLEEQRSRLTAIIDATPDFVATADTDGRVMYCNKAARKILDITDDADILNMRIPDAHPEWAARKILLDGLPTAAREGSWSGETAFITKDKRETPASQIIIAHRDSEGKVIFYSTIARDISEHKRVEKAIVRLNVELEHRVAARTAQLQEANKELEVFSYSVAHDLRAPLRIIDGFSHALLEDMEGRLDAVALDHIRRVRGAASRMSQLIDDLLELSRVTIAQMSHDTVNLSALAGVVAAELKKSAPDRNVEFVIEKGLTVTGDVRLLRIAIENLLGNAWKFTGKKEDGRIEFGASGTKDGRSVFHVRDNGAGFDMKYSDKLFCAFQRLHPSAQFDGTGIGLATVARVIKRHGGTVWAEGDIDAGATFYFTV